MDDPLVAQGYREGIVWSKMGPLDILDERRKKKKKKTVYISNLLNSYSYLLVRVRQEWSN